jgi:hypothetical protein
MKMDNRFSSGDSDLSSGDNGKKKLPPPAPLQTAYNTGRYFHITPTKHNYCWNKFASVTKQPELHNMRGGEVVPTNTTSTPCSLAMNCIAIPCTM